MCNKKLQKVATEFICNECDYITTRKSSYDKHLQTRKHKMLTNANERLIEKDARLFSCECGKSYKHNSSYHRHINKCKMNRVDSSLILKLINENITLQKQNSDQTKIHQQQLLEQQKQISDMIPRIGNTTNNKFNLNIFLNETCKDAMTLTDFVNNLEITLGDLDMVGEHGYMKGVSEIFIKGLRQMDITKRPIHCSDLKREILYIKQDELEWKKEHVDKQQVTDAIHKIHNNNFKQIKNWTEEHPNLTTNDHPDQIKYMNIISNCMNDSSQETSKIVKNIAKETTISKDY